MPSATRPSLQFGAGEGIRTLKKPILSRLRLPFRHARYTKSPPSKKLGGKYPDDRRQLPGHAPPLIVQRNSKPSAYVS